MSSPRSPQPPDGLEALGAAVRQVAEDSLFACAEPCERSRTARPARGPAGDRAVADRGHRLQRTVRRRRPDDAAARAGRGPRRRVLRRAAAVAGRVADRRLRRRAGQHGLRAVADADPPQRAVRADAAGRRRRGGARRRGDGRRRSGRLRDRPQRYARAARPRRRQPGEPGPDHVEPGPAPASSSSTTRRSSASCSATPCASTTTSRWSAAPPIRTSRGT